MTGVIVRTFTPRGFCFVSAEGRTYFLQANDLEGEWDGRVRAGARVEFEPGDGVPSLRALKAKLAS